LLTAPAERLMAMLDPMLSLTRRSRHAYCSQDAEFTIEFEQLRGWINDVKAIIHKDLWRNDTRSERCAGGGYIWVGAQAGEEGGGKERCRLWNSAFQMCVCNILATNPLPSRCPCSSLQPHPNQLRFGQGTDDYIATTQGMRRPVYVQSTWLRNTERWELPSGWLQQWVMGVASSVLPGHDRDTDHLADSAQMFCGIQDACLAAYCEPMPMPTYLPHPPHASALRLHDGAH
jgi:hypothetical protein